MENVPILGCCINSITLLLGHLLIQLEFVYLLIEDHVLLQQLQRGKYFALIMHNRLKPFNSGNISTLSTNVRELKFLLVAVDYE